MKRTVLFLCLLVGSIGTIRGQKKPQQLIDSLKKELSTINNDTGKLILMGQVANVYSEIFPDSAFVYAEQMLAQCRKLNLKIEEAGALNEMSYAQLNAGNYPRSLQYLLSAIAITTDVNSESRLLPAKFPGVDEFTDRTQPEHVQRLSKLGLTYQYAGLLYESNGIYEKALSYYSQYRSIAIETRDQKMQATAELLMGRMYRVQGHLDSALASLESARRHAINLNYERFLGSIYLNIGRVYQEMGKVELAKESYRQAIRVSTEQEYFRGAAAANLAMSELVGQNGNNDSTFQYIEAGHRFTHYLNAPDLYVRVYSALADHYIRVKNSDSALKYQSRAIRINDSLFNAKQMQQFQNIDFEEALRQQQAAEEERAFRGRVTRNSLLAGLGALLLIAAILFRNNRQKQKAKQKIEDAYKQLQSTQALLIQSEKMASLGELTAGIAHEIQNPLNFVNNFSDLNRELIDELQTDLQKGDIRDAAQLAENIRENEMKINLHGKRADGIVKSMLQHSSSSSGQKAPTDVNKLVDEYVRLAFHGYRTRQKDFNVKLNIDLDPAAGNLQMASQDIGRVVLNLLNNAFHAVQERSKKVGAGYEPTVGISTERNDGNLFISVTDNGSGIPGNIKEKIFQPFFTTKPTGQGTGLGLSLSYDIVKAHGGELRLMSGSDERAGNEGIVTEFRVVLPL